MTMSKELAAQRLMISKSIVVRAGLSCGWCPKYRSTKVLEPRRSGSVWGRRMLLTEPLKASSPSTSQSYYFTLKASSILIETMGKFEPKTPVTLNPPKDDPISVEDLAKCDGTCASIFPTSQNAYEWGLLVRKSLRHGALPSSFLSTSKKSG